MSEGDIRPFREPCDGASYCGLGPIFQHVSASGTNVFSTGTNSTLVANPLGGADIPPFEQWSADPGGGCGTYFMPTGTAWVPPFTANTFAFNGTNVEFSECVKKGFKNVQAKRNWHGALPWTAPEAGCPTTICSSGTTSQQAYQSSASQTKYLVWTADAHIRDTHTLGGVDADYTTADKTDARTVNGLSGETTSTLTTFEEDGGTVGTTHSIGKHTDGGAGYVDSDGDGLPDPGSSYASGGTTVLDDLDNDLHCSFPRFWPHISTTTDLVGFISDWNAAGHSTNLPDITNPNSYFAHIESDDGSEVHKLDIEFARTDVSVSWDFKYQKYPASDPSGNNTDTWHYYGSLTLSDANTAGSLKTDVVSLLAWWPLNDDALYPWRTDLKTGIAPLVSRSEVPTNVSPIGFNPYTVDDLTNPVDDASGNTPFSVGWTPTYAQIAWFDPIIYIWKFNPPTNSTEAAANVLIQQYDGSILGKPLPAGYQNYFDFGFNDIRGCCFRPGDGSQTWSWYQVGSGKNLGIPGGATGFNSDTGCHLPLNATQWNNWFQAPNKPPCAFMFYSDQADYWGAGCVSSAEGAISKAGDAGALVMGKWAETLELWPSQNFARPAGDDKFAYDEDFVYCATLLTGGGGGDSGLDFSGSTLSLIDPRTGSAPTDLSAFGTGPWGGPMVEGFYDVDSYSGGVVTLGSKIYDGPAGWTSKSGDSDVSFGRLRWPSAPSLLGRTAITPDVAGTTFTFATAQPNFGMDSSTHQEQVDLYNAAMTLLASNITATRVDDSTFTTVAAYATAAWVQINGAAKWYVNDTRPKGDFTKLDWTADLRTPGEYGRLSGQVDCDGTALALPTANAGGGPPTLPFADFNQTQCCLPFDRCNPKVVCISPNGEVFPNGITYDFPDTFLLDEQYGSKWWGRIESTMTDVLWQPPHRSCDIETCSAWVMDDGSCNDDVPGTCPAGEGSPAPIHFYAMAPQVEARLTVPSSSDACSRAYGMTQDEAGPALPSGTQIGWLSPVNYDTGEVALPPVAPVTSSSTGIPGGYQGPWSLHASLCADSDCRFGYILPPGCDPNL